MDYKKIGATAWTVAHARSLSDIKYSKEIFREISHFMDTATPQELEYLETAKTDNLAPMFEARYKLTNRIIDQSGIKQIIELAAGLTPRGMEYADKPDIKFVELDLPEPGDALDLDSIIESTKHFEVSPIVVVTEGLLRYLNFEQKAIVAKNIHQLLEKFGGFWVTPDISVNSSDHNK
jgi:O-methyltransferase involved in polyketide biosynthesis